MIDYFAKRPLLTVAILGVMFCVTGFYSSTAVFFVGLALILIFFALLYRRAEFKYLFVVFLLCMMSVSILLTTNKIETINNFSAGVADGSFIVLDDPIDKGEYLTATAETVDCKSFQKGTKLTVFYNNSTLECGDFVTSKVKVRAIKNEYKKSDYSQKIYLTGNMSDIHINENKKDPVLSLTGKIRAYIKTTLFSKLAFKEASTLVAIVTGDRTEFSDEFYGHIKAAGVSHVMVVSGMHLAIIVSMLSFLSEILFYNRFIKALTVFLTVLFMMTLCGFTMSIMRAGFSYMLYAFSILVKRENTPENTLGGAVIIMLIVSPFTVFSISFQLSVLSTLGIVAVALPVIKCIKQRELIKNGFLLALISMVAVSVSALIFTLPIVISVFGYIACFSVITNLLISFAVTAALSFAAAGLAVNAVLPIISPPFFFVSGIFTKYINYVIDMVGGLDIAVVRTGRYSFLISLIVLAVLITGLFACKRAYYMLKLKQMRTKIIKEGGGRLEWQ